MTEMMGQVQLVAFRNNYTMLWPEQVPRWTGVLGDDGWHR